MISLPLIRGSTDIVVPTVIAASPYRGLFQDVALWISGARGAASLLHYDNVQNLMCVASGFKRFYLVDQAAASQIEIDVPRGDYSAVDVDDVDLEKYTIY